MPIYEFYCPKNHRIYSFLAPSPSYQNRIPKCPDDPDLPLEKRISRFAITGKAKEDADDPFADIDDSKLDALMADMERDMGSMDDDNPDPRQLGSFMRKMGDALGKNLPPAFEDMIRRLEKGEDPEAIEESFGDQFDDADLDFGGIVRNLLTHRPPNRDPKLYDIRDFL